MSTNSTTASVRIFLLPFACIRFLVGLFGFDIVGGKRGQCDRRQDGKDDKGADGKADDGEGWHFGVWKSIENACQEQCDADQKENRQDDAVDCAGPFGHGGDFQ